MRQFPPARVGDPLDLVDTPALVLQLDALERNIARMATAVQGSGVRLRPHAKTHKCLEIARRQIAAGAVGVCVQKVSEAEALVLGGVDDVFVSNEVVGPQKLVKLAGLAERARISVCVDDVENVAHLQNASQNAGVEIDVLVDVDVGMGRCGVAAGNPAAKVARCVDSARNLRFAGLHAYQGSAQHLRTIAERRAAITKAIRSVSATVDALRRDGVVCPTITGAGTGTFVFELHSGLFTELQPGSYVFMDADYSRNEWAGFPSFEQSLFVLSTVMSRPTTDRAVVDAGLKALAMDSGVPDIADRVGIQYVGASDEHGVLRTEPGLAQLKLGDKLLLVPGHCDPTVNLHDWIVCTRNGIVEALWPIVSRGPGF